MNRTNLWRAAALLFAGLMSPAIAQTNAAKIKIENLTGFDTKWVQEAVVETVPKEYSERLAEGKYALWTFVDSVSLDASGETYCVAVVGLTYAASDGRNARIPKRRTNSLVESDKRGKLSPQETADCRGSALVSAITTLSRNNDWSKLARGADDMTSPGGTRKRQPADASQYSLERFGIVDDIGEIAIPSGFGAAFDYRELEIVLTSAAMPLGGQLVCYAVTGVAAKSPDNRNARFPGFYHSYLTVYNLKDKTGKAGREETAVCELAATNSAIASLMETPWDQTGVLKNLAVTREDGVALVTKARKVAAPAQPKVVHTTSRFRNVLSCHNECMNGACVRTFSNGRTENWQAPRVYNQALNDWEWKMDSCGN